MLIELTNCPICDGVEWLGLDELRNAQHWYNQDFIYKEPVGFKVCKTCGFLTYDYRDDKSLRDSYDSQRPVMQPQNIITCNRKNQYHHTFLYEILKDRIGKDSKVIDVGCAQGAMLDYMCNAYKVERHNAHGTEWSAGFRAFAKYRYGLNNVTEDIDETQKYDFISYYHVLEHVQYPQNHLLKCRELLKDDGYLYLSVPLFLGNLENEDGTPCDSFEHHYHINHVNCFTHQSFANILRLTGWEPIKQEQVYGWTVLCKKVDPVIDIVKEDYLKVQDILTRQKQAVKLMTERKFDEAETAYPEYPDLHIYKSMTSDLMKDINAQMPIVAKGLELMPGNRKLLGHMARILFQWDENNHKDQKYSNNIKQAEEIFSSLVQRFPGADDSMYFLGIIAMKYKKDYDEAIHWFGRCIDINPTRFMDCGQLICVAYKSKYEKEMRAS